jgi:hypothetical protein
MVVKLVSDIKRGTQTEGVKKNIGPKRVEVTRGWRKLQRLMMSFVTFTPRQV